MAEAPANGDTRGVRRGALRVHARVRAAKMPLGEAGQLGAGRVARPHEGGVDGGRKRAQIGANRRRAQRWARASGSAGPPVQHAQLVAGVGRTCEQRQQRETRHFLRKRRLLRKAACQKRAPLKELLECLVN